MKKMMLAAFLIIAFAVLAPRLADPSSSLPSYPFVRHPVRADAAELQKALDIYRLTKKDRHDLHWDPCLARKALQRAKQLVNLGYFDHKDPRTGRNPAWELVRHCFSCRSSGDNLAWAGENLAKGMGTPENIHKALMSSPTHRRNIMNSRFERIGVACYDDVCVELFAGF